MSKEGRVKTNKVRLAPLSLAIIATVLAGAGCVTSMSTIGLTGETYENHIEYLVIDRQDEAPEPMALLPTAAEVTESDLDGNIVVVLEKVLNEEIGMLKKTDV